MKENIQNHIYSYIVLYKKGLTVHDFENNTEMFSQLCEYMLQGKDKTVRNLNISFFSSDKKLFEIKSKDKNNVKFRIDIKEMSCDLFTKLLFGRINCFEFLYRCSTLHKEITVNTLIYEEHIIEQAYNSWNVFLNRVGYEETQFIVSDESKDAQQKIRENHIIWCYNKSCTGKTYLGIQTLMYSSQNKFVYNPTAENACTAEFIKTLLFYGTDAGILLDDLQCDVGFATEIFEYLAANRDDIKNRNLYIFITSWTSMFNSPGFSGFQNVITTITTKPQKFINIMKEKINDSSLLNLCGDNLALISAAMTIRKRDCVSTENIIHDLFKMFVKTEEPSQLKIVYVLAVLGTYEFETPITFSESYGNLDLNNVPSAKISGKCIFLAHRTISNFIARYIESNRNFEIESRKDIIKKYIGYIDNRKKWKALQHLIGEDRHTDILSVSPLWNLMYEFQRNLSRQTKMDPSWENTPSSMYFVISTAKMLGVVDEYKDVVDALCSNFSISDGKVIIKYNLLQTTVDFVKIKSRMIEEDKSQFSNQYESGEEIDLEQIHRNWLYGLMIGLKDVLIEFGYHDLISAIENELLALQNKDGYWYPRRVPWVTSRILIGLSEAGYSVSNSFIKKGVEYLEDTINDNRWEAHTGGWNNEFETSSLALEALVKCGADYDKANFKKVATFLLDTSSIWMSENYEIDGTTTACVLLKILGIQTPLLEYINRLSEKDFHKIMEESEHLDYDNVQSCKTTQIAYYVIELCWYILEKDISELLDKFISRAEQGRELNELSKKKIFISYSEDSKAHIKRVGKIASFLENNGFEVYFYANAPLGTNNMVFMQNITVSDVIIVIGTKQYKEKSMNIKRGGAFFEACILSREFMNENYEKIIPISFDEFNESFPEPIAINKGMRVKRIDEHMLSNLLTELNNKLF